MTDINSKLDKILNLLEGNTGNTGNLQFDNNMYIKCLIHELRTPITSVSLGLNVMERKVMSYQCGEKQVTPECTNDSLTLIRDLHNTIQYIENTLTKFCIIQDGNLTLNEFEVFSINCIIKGVKKLLWHHIQEKNIRLECNIDENIYEWVYGDKCNIKHCIMNIIKNAIKYSNQNSNNNHIIINIKMYNDILFDDEEDIIISIQDNNQPIPSHIKNKLFQPFNTTSGSGLGLYICNKIIELHKGIITHEYLDDNIGNQFSIILKLKKCKDIKQHIHHTELLVKPSRTPSPSLSTSNRESNLTLSKQVNNDDKYNIIIVDDSEINLKMMKKVFGTNDNINKIFLAKDGLEAINIICNNKDIDMVFIDNQMPNLNGVQTVQILRGIHFDKVIIGITGSTNKELSNFYNCGIDYVFAKPFDKDKVEIVFDFLEKKDIHRHSNKTLQMVESKLEWV